MMTQTTNIRRRDLALACAEDYLGTASYSGQAAQSRLQLLGEVFAPTSAGRAWRTPAGGRTTDPDKAVAAWCESAKKMGARVHPTRA